VDFNLAQALGNALVREVMPFLAVMIGALALITLVPDLVLFLPGC
jgi:TRAP-type C4-dicarboxylate transport system permease large subunit